MQPSLCGLALRIVTSFLFCHLRFLVTLLLLTVIPYSLGRRQTLSRLGFSIFQTANSFLPTNLLLPTATSHQSTYANIYCILHHVLITLFNPHTFQSVYCALLKLSKHCSVYLTPHSPRQLLPPSQHLHRLPPKVLPCPSPQGRSRPVV